MRYAESLSNRPTHSRNNALPARYSPDHEKWNSSPRCKGGRCEEDTFNNVWSGKAIQSTKQTGVNWTCDNLLIGFNLAARHANILKDEIAVVMSAFE